MVLSRGLVRYVLTEKPKILSCLLERINIFVWLDRIVFRSGACIPSISQVKIRRHG
jgi:hypothetical protein